MGGCLGAGEGLFLGLGSGFVGFFLLLLFFLGGAWGFDIFAGLGICGGLVDLGFSFDFGFGLLGLRGAGFVFVVDAGGASGRALERVMGGMCCCCCFGCDEKEIWNDRVVKSSGRNIGARCDVPQSFVRMESLIIAGNDQYWRKLRVF